MRDIIAAILFLDTYQPEPSAARIADEGVRTRTFPM
jgi:hypothetical protein